SRPKGEPTPQNFRLEEAALPTLKDGEVLVRHHYLSLDPYMRGRMNEGKSYAQPQPLEAVMIGGTVGEVVESRASDYKAGDTVVGMGGWQQYSVVNGTQPGALRKIDTSRVPISAYLGVVGQLAKARGCRAVGIAGGADKCSHVVRDLGFDACIDYKQLDGTAAIAAALKEQCPNGIDGYFENVGGA